MSEFAHNILFFCGHWLLFGAGLLVAGFGLLLITYAACTLSMLAERRHQRRLEVMQMELEFEKVRCHSNQAAGAHNSDDRAINTGDQS
jgi:hypothetical protein